jgi:hypothetical protein
MEHQGCEVNIGARNEIRARLPLSPAEDFLATDQQRTQIAKKALSEVLATDYADQLPDWSHFDELRAEIKRRTGVNDAAAALILFATLG